MDQRRQPTSQPSSVERDAVQDQRCKRRKIALACDQCRVRKSRCDGVRPACGECSQRRNQSDPCRYKSHFQKDPDHEEYVKTLLDRIQQLERREGTAQSQHELSNATHSVQKADNVPLSALSSDVPADELAQLSSKLPNDNSPKFDSPNAVSQNPVGEVSPVDAMGANSTVDPEEQEIDSRYYGSSSAVSFMQQVYKTIWNGLSGSSSEHNLNGSPFSSSSSPGSHLARPGSEKFWALRGVEQLSLLPRPVVDRALNCYWDRIYHLYPFIHKPTFMRAYKQLWKSQPTENDLALPGAGLGGSTEYGPNSIVFHCALNLMLALATEMMELQLEDRRRLGKLFAGKARSLCQLDLFDDGSLAAIQTLLLMTQYLQSAPSPNSCWNCIGSACRLAQGLGLYIENPQSNERFSPLEIEMRRRVWHGCVMLDAVVSMTLGRPLMLYKYQEIPLPSAVDDEYLADPTTQPIGHISWGHLYVQSLKLYTMLAEIVSQMYGLAPVSLKSIESNDKRTGSSTFDFILDSDSAISEFEAQIPDHLHWERRTNLPDTIKHVNIFEQQSSVLLVRYLHLRILLYRPTFTRYCQQISAQEMSRQSSQEKPYYSTQTSSTIARSLSISCVNTSILLIEQIYLRSTTRATGAWWYNLFYARTAGIVVLLTMVCRSVSESVGWAKLTDAWNKCQAALSSLQKFSPTVMACLKSLEKLHQHILNYKHSAGMASDDCTTADALNTTTAENGFFNQIFDTDQDQPFIPSPQGLFGENGSFGWPGPEISLLDNIFASDFGLLSTMHPGVQGSFHT